MALVPRAVESRVREALRVSRAVALTGPRQAGKTTLARQLQAAGLALEYFSLDDDATRAAAIADPDGFALSLPRPAVIEEVQRAPGLLAAVGRILARDPTPGQFLLTSSVELPADRPASQRVRGFAVDGRANGGHDAGAQPLLQRLSLWPLAQAELVGAPTSVIDQLLEGAPPHVIGAGGGRAATAELVLAGGYPPACVMTTAARGRYFDDYLQQLVARDLPEVGEVRLDPSMLRRLLVALAGRDSAAVNHAALARHLGVDGKTVKAHVELLARLLLLVRLAPWPLHLGARQVKAPRMLLCDSGLAATLAGIDSDAYTAPARGPSAPMLLETFAIMELVKQAGWRERELELSFYRDTEKRSADLVIESPGGDVAAVCATVAASSEVLDTRGLRFLRDRLGSRFRAGIVVYTGEQTVQLDDRVWALPLSGLLG